MSTSAARAITTGPRYHWFGYYDKLQFDPTSRYVLGMAVDFEHRSPSPDDTVEIGMVDLHDGDRWIRLGQSNAWGWQQGCMLQWRPDSDREVLWNDREGDRYVCRILDVRSGQMRTLPAPIYTLSPDGQWALGTDFRRINDMRPGYGYAGLPDPHADQLAPDASGIYRMELATGHSEQILSIAQIATIPYPHGDLSDAKHYFNHLLVNPDGTRFIFLHRWRFGDGPFHTRMLTAAMDGSALHVVDDYGQMSHFIWRDPRHILAWAWHPSHEAAFYLYRDQTDAVEVVGEGVMTLNGHCTYLPGGDSHGNEWILNDNYAAQDPERLQRLYLYHVARNQRHELGAFYSPRVENTEWRCDLHPRSNADGRLICIDSDHGGSGRQMYLVERHP